MANTVDDSTLNFVSSASVSSSRLFSTKKINVTLYDHNYLLWHQQVFLTIKTHMLQKYIDSNISWPTQYVTRDGVVSLNPEYELYEKHDGAHASWLLSTVNEEVLPHLIGLNTAAEMWNTLHRLYSGKTTSRLMSYRRMFHSQRKGDLSMREYLMKFKSVYDNLASCGEIISEHEHITAILNGLPPEFESVVTVITATPTPPDLRSVSTILLDTNIRQLQSFNHVTACAHITTQASADQVASNNASYSEYQNKCYYRFDMNYKNESSRPTQNTNTKGYSNIQANVSSYSPSNDNFNPYNPVYYTRSAPQISQFSTPQVSAFRPQNHPVNIQHQICLNPYNMSSFSSGNTNQFTVATQPHVTSQAYIATPETVDDNSWYPDSGATHHITKDFNNLQIKDTLPGTDFMLPLLMLIVERQFGVKLKAFQSDGGGEFGALQAYMKEQGTIETTTSSPLPSPSPPPSLPPLPSPSPPPSPPRLVQNAHPMVTRGKAGIFKPKVVQSEYNALMKNGTWEVKPLPPARKPVGCKWLFKVKKKPDGSVERLKARLVAKGYSQMVERDFSETFSPVPPGFEQRSEDGKELVCCLKKALYGLKQAPRAWFETLRKFMIESLDFVASKADSSLINRNSACSQVLLMKYISELLKRSSLDESTPTPTLMVVAPKIKANVGQLFSDVHLYRSIVGGLQYICLTRPDIAYAVNKVSQYMNSMCDTHWRAMKRILRYLSGALKYGLFFSQTKKFSPIYYTDVDWAASVEDRRSTTGYCVYLGGNPVAWCSKKKSVVSISTSEAEYRSLANSVSELVWIEQLLGEIGIRVTGKPVVWCDNTSTISMAANRTHHARIKHVEIDIHFVRERVLAEKLSVNFVPFVEQVADILTKLLPPEVFGDMRSLLGVKSWAEINGISHTKQGDQPGEESLKKPAKC
ncbi:hypothetical protein F3Y22_tig00110387pilonHSYRG00340 [Hibiscus syriacus]|uniref:Reverse transcriptase Ty1/copia-type domain-containing protein n=1 Tax=Hibiscus syriacus TaxID=106335 RepID=A0A6A3AT37_HIBSY|nr:hypothetical protein F3Y22_tig00110387pilonHSYRG00340 [Hibiscus syriacus]